VIDEGRVEEFARIVKRLRYQPISFDNLELFPEPDGFVYPNYIFFMVAIDHRTGFDDVDFKYHGSDLLFYLARKKQAEAPDFFTAKNLVKVNIGELRRVFTFEGKEVSRLEERVYLLRDCAKKLLEIYQGDFMNLLHRSGFRAERIRERLKMFRAYEDPLMKKSFLLLKILKRQGFGIEGRFEFPVDSVLVRLAISSRIIKPEKEVMKKIEAGVMLDEKETELLRRQTQKALLMVSEKAGVEPDVLDDVLWTYGRELDAENIKTPLDERVDESALRDFVGLVREGLVRKIKFPSSWYF
jgi:hypothetical protein